MFAIPDEAARENRFEIGIPNLASIILKHHGDGVVPGLNDYVAADGTPLHPRVAPEFYAFRVMIGTGMLMLLISWGCAAIMLRKRVDGPSRRGVKSLPKVALYALVAMTFAGWLATLAGWYTTEIGRQPWLVQGVLSTKAAVADVPAPMVLSTLIGYLLVYAALLGAYVLVNFYLARKVFRGEPLGPVRPETPKPIRPDAFPTE